MLIMDLYKKPISVVSALSKAFEERWLIRNMRKFICRIGAFVLILSMVFSVFPVTSMEVEAASGPIPIYRLYCPVNGEHLYTTDAHERDVLYREHGWGYEGVAWYADTTGTPVYRLYNSGLRNHLYTSNPEEVEVLLKIKEWSMDNNGEPLFYSNGYEPIYRVYNEALSGMHHLTTDRNEYDVLPSYGWVQEGANLYARVNGSPITTQYYPAQMPATPQVNLPSQTEGSWTIDNISEPIAIEADVTLSGTGTGSHAKLVICTPTSAVSFGPQYDTCAMAPYTGKTMLLIENVANNAAGGQRYTRPSNQEVALGQTCHLMITMNNDGSGNVYLNKNKIGSFQNKEMADQQIYLRVEGSARLNGDTVDATFKNIRIKNKGSVLNSWSTHPFITCDSIIPVANAYNDISISGHVSGLAPGKDWDSAYDEVSGIIQFVVE